MYLLENLILIFPFETNIATASNSENQIMYRLDFKWHRISNPFIMYVILTQCITFFFLKISTTHYAYLFSVRDFLVLCLHCKWRSPNICIFHRTLNLYKQQWCRLNNFINVNFFLTWRNEYSYVIQNFTQKGILRNYNEISL